MKQGIKLFICIALLSTAVISADNCCSPGVAPYYSIRSQSEDSARELAGWVNQVNLYDMQKMYGTFAITPEYTQSFRSNRIACCLFGESLQGCCDCPTIQISGTRVEDRCSCDWLADYFGLAPDFQSTISFEPRVQNFLVDFNLYLGLDEWLDGLYFRIHAPLVHARWRLNFCECICETGTQGYDEGYFSSNAIPRENLLNSATSFFSNCGAPDLGTLPNVVFEPLVCCKWSNCECDPLTTTRLSDIQVAFGWNFLQNEDHHFGLNIRFAAPTGTRPKAEYLFEPVVGNGHHWEFGGGYSAHVILWRSENEDRHFGFYTDGNFTHLFSARQCRCFDLCCPGQNSRYMLAARFGTPIIGNLLGNVDGSLITPNAQFNLQYAPVANLTHQIVDVSVGLQADITAMFNFTSRGFTWDLGYNFWGRSCEKIRPRCDCPAALQDGKTWVLKGDSQEFGFFGQGVFDWVALSASQTGVNNCDCANIHRGRNFDGVRNVPEAQSNAGIDNPFPGAGGPLPLNLFTNRTNFPTTPVNTSVQPQFLSTCDVDFNGAQTKGISHKVFTHFSYQWIDRERWMPYLGIGAKVEFGGPGDCCCDDCCDTITSCCDTTCDPCCNLVACDPCDNCCDCCQTCNLSEWGIWLKGGFAFD